MKKSKELSDILDDLVIQTAKSRIDHLKPEIKKQVIFRFSDEIKNTTLDGKDGVYRAEIELFLRPAVVTLYVRAIRGSLLGHLWDDLGQLLSHELTHLYTGSDEKATNEVCVKLNFFDDRKSTNSNNKD